MGPVLVVAETNKIKTLQSTYTEMEQQCVLGRTVSRQVCIIIVGHGSNKGHKDKTGVAGI